MKKILLFGIVNLCIALMFIPSGCCDLAPIPMLSVSTDDATKTIETRSTVSFPITIKSIGENTTEVLIEVITYPEGWTPHLSNASLLLQPDEEQEITFSITPPESGDNAWGAITLEFTPRFFPVQVGDPQGTPTQLELRVNIREPSTPGFELVLVAVALACIFLWNRKRIP